MQRRKYRPHKILKWKKLKCIIHLGERDIIIRMWWSDFKQDETDFD